LLDVGRKRAASVFVDEAGEEGLEMGPGFVEGMENTLDDATGWVPPHDVGRARLVVVGVAVATPHPGSRRLVQPREDWA